MGKQPQSNRVLEVTLLWGDMPQASELIDGPLTLGEGAQIVLPREVLAAPVELATPVGDAWMLNVPSFATGHVFIGDKAIDVQELATDARGLRTTLLGPSARAQIGFGTFTVLLSSIERPVAPKRVLAFDPSARAWIAGSAIVHGALLGILFLSPPKAGALSTDMDFRETRRLIFATIPDQQPTPPPEPIAEGASEADGKRAAGEEGSAGSERGQPNRADGVQQRGNRTEHTIANTHIDVAMTGFIGVLQRHTGMFNTILHDNGMNLDTGFASVDAYASAMNGEIGEGQGPGGLSLRGTGRGGGCLPGQDCTAGTVGVGDIGTNGGRGTCSVEVFDGYVAQYGREDALRRCDGHGRGVRGNGLGGRNAHVPDRIRTTCGANDCNVAPGGLSREQVQRAIHHHVNEVRHCYEEGLRSHPDLNGRISVAFVVMPDGRVQSSAVAQNDLSDPNVAQCVAQAARRWSFPSSEGVTAVRYPFVFEHNE